VYLFLNAQPCTLHTLIVALIENLVSKPDVQESHHRKARGQGTGCGHVTGWVNISLGSRGHEVYFESTKRLGARKGYLKNPLWMRRGVEGLQFCDKFKKCLFPNLFSKGDRAPENKLVN
jgi:hypothetical protein